MSTVSIIFINCQKPNTTKRISRLYSKDKDIIDINLQGMWMQSQTPSTSDRTTKKNAATSGTHTASYITAGSFKWRW